MLRSAQSLGLEMCTQTPLQSRRAHLPQGRSRAREMRMRARDTAIACGLEAPSCVGAPQACGDRHRPHRPHLGLSRRGGGCWALRARRRSQDERNTRADTDDANTEKNGRKLAHQLSAIDGAPKALWARLRIVFGTLRF